MSRPLAVGGISFFSVCALLCAFDASADAAQIAFALCAAGLALSLLSKSLREVRVIPFALVCGTSACLLFFICVEFVYHPALEIVGEQRHIVAEVVGLSESNNTRYYCEIETSSVDGVERKARLRLSTGLPLDAKPYDRVEFTGTVYQLGSSSESQAYYRSSGLFLGAYSFGEIAVSPAERRPVFYYILASRSHIRTALMHLLPNDSGALLIAMLIGDKSLLSPEIDSDFRDSGTAHLLAVSGLHMSIWAFGFFELLRRLRLGQRLSAVLSCLFVLFFMALTGFSASCVRSGIMVLTQLVGLIISRRSDGMNSLGLSLMIIVFINPFEAASVSLWLSFLATAGIITLRGKLFALFKRPFGRFKSRFAAWFFDFFCGNAALTVSATAMCLPVLILCFSRVSLVAPLTNLLAVSAAGASMFCGGIAALLWALTPISFLAYPFAVLGGIGAKYTLFVTSLLADLPLSSVSVYERYIAVWLGASMLITALALLFSLRSRHTGRLAAVSVCSCLFALLCGISSFSLVFSGVSEITVLSVGNATAAVLSKGGQTVLIGCGGEYYTSGIVSSELSRHSEEPPAAVLVPRAEATEAGCAKDIIAQCGAQRLFLAENDITLEYLAQENGSELTVSPSGSFSPWSGTEISYFDSDDASCAYVSADGVGILFVFYWATDFSLVPQQWLDADILICRSRVPARLDGADFAVTLVSAVDEGGLTPSSDPSRIGASTGLNGNVSVGISREGFRVYR